jgi:CheY-like chemotaxis protein
MAGTTQILANNRTKHIPVVALTAHALESDRRKSVEVGCVDFETKPISLPDLIEKIERHTR